MPGLDPGIHPFSSQEDGWPGPGYAKASPGTPVSGRRSFSEAGKPGHDRESVVDPPPKAVNPRKNP
jgi:hypothetical protein